VRITAQLIEGVTDAHVWAERYDRTLDDIFALQDEISAAIVSALKVKLLPEEKEAITLSLVQSASELMRLHAQLGILKHPVNTVPPSLALRIDTANSFSNA